MGSGKTDMKKVSSKYRYWEKLKSGFFCSPNFIFYDSRLSREEKLLYCVLRMHSFKERKVFLSEKSLADWLDCSVRSIKRWKKNLKKTGWINWERKKKYCIFEVKIPRQCRLSKNYEEKVVSRESKQGFSDIRKYITPKIETFTSFPSS